jgi:hypothetical protein
MAAIRSRNTKPELLLRAELRRRGILIARPRRNLRVDGLRLAAGRRVHPRRRLDDSTDAGVRRQAALAGVVGRADPGPRAQDSHDALTNTRFGPLSKPVARVSSSAENASVHPVSSLFGWSSGPQVLPAPDVFCNEERLRRSAAAPGERWARRRAAVTSGSPGGTYAISVRPWCVLLGLPGASSAFSTLCSLVSLRAAFVSGVGSPERLNRMPAFARSIASSRCRRRSSLFVMPDPFRRATASPSDG